MNKRIALLSLTGVLALASCGQTTVDPTCNTNQTLQNGVCVDKPVTLGGVSFTNPNGYTIVVKDVSGKTIPATDYNKLAPDSYTATFSKTGYVEKTVPFTVNAGATTPVTAPELTAVPAPKNAAYYVDAKGALVAIPADAPASAFRFVAWAENLPNSGLNVTSAGGIFGVTGTPTADEQDEVAPLNRQNVLGAYMSYSPDGTTSFPVVGADVRWDITAQTGSVRFSAADDGALDSGAMRPQDINANALSALTWTNRAVGATNVAYPSNSQKYPLFNLTGVDTPNTNGYTWTTLNHDPASVNATARVRVVGYVNGMEIDKQWLSKTFAPSADLVIAKTPKTQTVNIGDNATFTVTVTNRGAGAASNVKLSDVLSSGTASNYQVVNVTGGTIAGTGFNATLAIPAATTAANGTVTPATATVTLVARASAVGQYCDTATVNSYDNGAFGTVTPSGLSDSACVTVIAPTLNIIKELVDASGNVIPSPAIVAKNTNVFARITVRNSGTAAASNVVVTEALQGPGTAANYTLSAVTAVPNVATTKNTVGNGFSSAPFSLAAGATQTFTFPAQASADGTYCDNAAATATTTSGTAVTVAGSPTANVCFTVTSPNLSITKQNQTLSGTAPVPSLYPGSSYRSVITVANTGTGAATNVAVSDLLGNLNGTFMTFGSGTFTITNANGSVASTGSLVAGTPANTVTTVPANVTLASGQRITLTLTSTVPTGAAAGQYCNVATFASANAGTNTVRDCVNVINFVSTRTQMSDGDNTDPTGQNKDPFVADGKTVITLGSGFSVENTSNQGVRNNVVVYNFGSTDPRGATPGVFQVLSTDVYYDPTPTVNPKDGSITSDYTRPGVTKLSLGTQYTLTPGATVAPGQSQTLTLSPSFSIAPGGVVWVRHNLVAPAGTAPRTYNSSLLWTGNGTLDNASTGGASSEPTTTLLPN